MGKPEDTSVSSTGDDRTVNNTLRHEYRVLSDEEKALMQLIKDQGLMMLNTLLTIANRRPEAARETAIAKTKLEETVMWAVKGLTK